MAFRTLKTRGKIVTLAELADEIAERRAAAGGVTVPRNAGTRRTPSKAALLEQIAKLDGDW
jgi:hypothetical protein